MRRFGIFAGTTAALLWAGAAQAQLSGPGHTDVLLGNSGGRITIGFNDDTQFYRDRFDSLPIDAATGHAIFPAKFGEFPGVGVLVTGTDDPGFQAYAGTFGSREYLYYRALGTLEVWTPTTQTWDAPTGGETVALYGALPPELRLTCAAVSPPPACIPYQDGTRIHADGITG
ncbi:MAG: hypothetical protein KIT73_14635, partial [Burkholderiales bacterium]|nr:hypothetical protein [Burkholderiales bacterium]